MKKVKKPKDMKGKYWAYFAPDGYLQVRSIADTKKDAREFLASGQTETWRDYEKEGFRLFRVEIIPRVIT